MNQEEKNKCILFAKIGMLVLSALLLIGLGINYIPQVVETSIQNSNKKLPIYCVDCKEKKVSLSFDAACGGGNLR